MPASPPLDHIRWRRLSPSAPRKLRPNRAGMRFPPRLQPETHGEKLAQETIQSLDQLSHRRTQSGIDPAKLLVLNFNFLEVGQREHLNRLGIEILEEKEQRVPIAEPIYNVGVKFNRPEHRLDYLENHAPSISGLKKIEDNRASNGEIDPKRITLSFSTREEAKSYIQSAQSSGMDLICSKDPVRKTHDSNIRLLGQFADETTINKFKTELDTYKSMNTSGGELTFRQRRELFDALEDISDLNPEEKTGVRLREEGFPEGDSEVYFDVDLWYPGRALIAEAIRQFNALVTSEGGRVTDPPTVVADTMLLARVKGKRPLLDKLLKYDRVAYIDLPPRPAEYHFSIFDQIELPTNLPVLDPNGPLACIIDSGVVAGHPLLRNVVVDERDFESGENTPVDKVGHGTHCAGIVVYGDVGKCIAENSWQPKVQILSAKVMKRSEGGDPIFADDARVETQIRNAITTYANEYGCRIFNLSIGHASRPYLGGRQLPWAQLIDQLCRELDVVCVVSTGNVSLPSIPTAVSPEEFQLSVRDELLSDNHALIDPATSMLALTVGSLAKNDHTFASERNQNQRGALAASPADGPSPFTRSGACSSNGPAPKRAIKPELVGYGGNYVLGPTGNNWARNDVRIGIPSLNFDYNNRALAVSSGTSVSAPYITHCCSLVESALRQLDIARPSANLIRALTVHGAKVPATTVEWIGKNTTEKALKDENVMRLVGHGLPSVERSSFSTDNRVTLFSEDEIQENHVHLYEIEVPNDFITKAGMRELRVTLAYDPPVRGTRREYLGRTMWFQVYRGLTSEFIFQAMSSTLSPGDRPNIQNKYILQCDPAYTTLEWSTVQSANFSTDRKGSFNYRVEDSGPAIIHILVGCKHKFPCDISVTQKYALIASLEHSHEEIKLHQVIRQRVEHRNRINWPGR